ncbi:MAG: gamma-glutamyl-gamma-aminobutyrate hydrolase family protein [Microbacteriaceae bacterium]|nr:gamma-glutamyl-gamma-aminobutyrate hydrolase family protein [Microbacteriaceae bacterium]
MSASNRPVIGITTYRQQAKTGVWDVDAAFLHSGYIESVTRAGGIAVLLPPQPASAEVVDRVLDGVDGLIFAGGRDVNPDRYNQTPGEHTDQPDVRRDDWEFALVATALARQLPILFICRGAQVLNVHRGGTLIQHLPDVVGSDDYQRGNAQFTDMEMAVESGSVLESIVGSTVSGHVYHHQAIDAVGKGLTVTARSADAVVEALEIDDYPFGVAIQWHPEVTSEKDGRLFDALITAARTPRSNS